MHMDFIHYQVQAGPNQLIQVRLNDTANVRVLDNVDYNKYLRGSSDIGTSSLVETGVFEYRPHRSGLWHVIVDLNGISGQVTAKVEVFHS